MAALNGAAVLAVRVGSVAVRGCSAGWRLAVMLLEGRGVPWAWRLSVPLLVVGCVVADLRGAVVVGPADRRGADRCRTGGSGRNGSRHRATYSGRLIAVAYQGAAMTTEGQALLDNAEWMVQSTALLPTDEPTTLSSLAFALSPELQAKAYALVNQGADISSELAEFFSEALDLDVDVFGDSVAVLGSDDDWAGENGLLRSVVGRYGELAGLRIDSYDLADVIGEFLLPVFASQAKDYLSIEQWGTRAGLVVTAVAGVAPIVGGHAAVLLALIAPPLGTAVIIGTYGAIGAVAGIGYLKRRHREKRAKKLADEAARKQADEAATKQAEQEGKDRLAAEAAARVASVARRQELADKAKAKPRLKPHDSKTKPAE